MNCPSCNNPGVEIIRFDDVNQESAIDPILIIAPDAFWCPCGCIFDATTIIMTAPENVIPEWWLSLPESERD